MISKTAVILFVKIAFFSFEIISLVQIPRRRIIRSKNMTILLNLIKVDHTNFEFVMISECSDLYFILTLEGELLNNILE